MASLKEQLEQYKQAHADDQALIHAMDQEIIALKSKLEEKQIESS